jgi:mitochondrial fission protein ELM1
MQIVTMSVVKETILLLNDGRIGNFNQVKALTQNLEQKYNIIEKKITFSFFIFLPNFINLFFNTGVNHKKLTRNVTKANFILSSGRRSALAAVIIKKKIKDAQIIQLMRPELKAKYFSFIATPKHDNYKFADYEMLLAPNLISAEALSKAAKKWPKSAKPLKIIAIIIGGDTKNNKINHNKIQTFCAKIHELQQKYKLKLIIVTSRRTPLSFADELERHFSKNTDFFFWHKINQKNNPYLSILAIADYFLVTADSVSMISDCLATAKPTIIYKSGFGELKHQKIINNLIKNNYIFSMEQVLKEENLNIKAKKLVEAHNLQLAISKKLRF